MTVRRGVPIVFEAGKDFFRTDRGITWGIKVTDTGELRFCHVFEKTGESWVVAAELAGLDWPNELPAFGGNVRNWFVSTALPKLNTWLAQRFPAIDSPPSSDPSEQLDALIADFLRVRKNERDGTLSAELS